MTSASLVILLSLKPWFPSQNHHLLPLALSIVPLEMTDQFSPSPHPSHTKVGTLVFNRGK